MSIQFAKICKSVVITSWRICGAYFARMMWHTRVWEFTRDGTTCVAGSIVDKHHICHLQGASWTSSFWGQFRPWNAVRSIPCAVRSMINCDCYKNATNKTMKCSCLQWRNAFPSYEIWSLYDFRSSSCFSLSTTFVEFLMHLFGLLTLTVYSVHCTVYTVHSSFLVGQQSSTIIIRTCAGGELLLKMENFD